MDSDINSGTRQTYDISSAVEALIHYANRFREMNDKQN